MLTLFDVGEKEKPYRRVKIDSKIVTYLLERPKELLGTPYGKSYKFGTIESHMVARSSLLGLNQALMTRILRVPEQELHDTFMSFLGHLKNRRKILVDRSQIIHLFRLYLKNHEFTRTKI